MKARRTTLGVINTGNLEQYSSTINNAGYSSDSQEDEPVSLIDCIKEKPKQNVPVLLSARSTNLYGEEPAIIQWRGIWTQSTSSLIRSVSIIIAYCYLYKFASVSPEFPQFFQEQQRICFLKMRLQVV